jgi:D-3-phosphoglycerate dehydrogenase
MDEARPDLNPNLKNHPHANPQLTPAGNPQQTPHAHLHAGGGVVDEAALLDGLSDGSVLGAALDSLQEEPDVSTALLAAQASGATLLITPHAAFYSDEAFGEMRLLAAREVRRVLRTEAPHYRMN